MSEKKRRITLPAYMKSSEDRETLNKSNKNTKKQNSVPKWNPESEILQKKTT